METDKTLAWQISLFPQGGLSGRNDGISTSTSLTTTGFLHLSTIDIWGWTSVCCGAVLCIVGCLAESLAATHEVPVAPSPQPAPGCNKWKCLQTLPDSLKGQNYPCENHCPTTGRLQLYWSYLGVKLECANLKKSTQHKNCGCKFYSGSYWGL